MSIVKYILLLAPSASTRPFGMCHASRAVWHLSHLRPGLHLLSSDSGRMCGSGGEGHIEQRKDEQYRDRDLHTHPNLINHFVLHLRFNNTGVGSTLRGAGGQDENEQIPRAHQLSHTPAVQ